MDDFIDQISVPCTKMTVPINVPTFNFSDVKKNTHLKMEVLFWAELKLR